MTLAKKIYTLDPAIVGAAMAKQMESALHCLDSPEVLIASLNRAGLILCENLFAAVKEKRPSNNFSACLDAAEKRGIIHKGFLVDLHYFRLRSNDASHVLSDSPVAPELAQGILSQFLQILEWFHTGTDSPNPNHVRSIYWTPAPLAGHLDPNPDARPQRVPHSVADYLRWLIQEIEEDAAKYSPLAGEADISPQLPAAHVRGRSKADFDELLVADAAPSRAASMRKPYYDNAISAFDDLHRAVVLGEPGCGKSTTLLRLAVDLARRAQQDDAAPVPIFADLADWTTGEPLNQFLQPAFPGGLANRRTVLLLDSLNEMPVENWRAKADQIKKHPCGGLFVTCREKDYGSDLHLGLDTLRLKPLTPEKIHAVLRQWAGQDPTLSPALADQLFWQLAGDQRLAPLLEKWRSAGATERDFWSLSRPNDHEAVYKATSAEEDRLWSAHVPNPRSLLKLAANPLLLTMLYRVWRETKSVPTNRGSLVERFVRYLFARAGLMQKDDRQGWSLTPQGEALSKGLANLAWEMQRAPTGASTTLPYSRVVSVLGANDPAGSDAGTDIGGKSLAGLARGAWLLDGGDTWQFRHQLLQEYFAARALEPQLPNLKAAELWPADRWWQRNGWEEAMALLTGLRAAEPWAVIEWLADAQPEVAAQCILEGGAEPPNGSQRDNLLARWLPRLTGDEPPAARAAVGRALGRLGLDKRKGVGVGPDGLPEIDWVTIPGGTFTYQEEKGRPIETFRISRYPVTNAQFEAFLKDGEGYKNPRWWEGLEADERPEGPGWWNEANHPRETVNWFEAMAYCEWLSAKLGYKVTLPTEEQWERAAAGREGREYPWGGPFEASRANTSEGGLHRTSPVGVYPTGASEDGVMDMSGNVWEWCLNEYDDPKRTQKGGRNYRVLRGGAWDGISGGARASCRVDARPLARDIIVGFRVVSESPIDRRSAGR